MKKNFEYFLKQIKENQAPSADIDAPNDGNLPSENMAHPFAEEILDRYKDLVESGEHTSIGAIEVIATALDMLFPDVWEIIENNPIVEDVFKLQKPSEDSFTDIKDDKGTCSVCKAEQVTIANHVCMTPIAEGVNSSSIERKVAEINKLIASAIDSDGDAIGVVDTSGTWQSKDYYSPIKYVNGVLYIEYKEQDNKINKDKILKRDMEMDGIPTLNNIAKMYRAAIKKASKPEKQIDENNSSKLDFSKILKDIEYRTKILKELSKENKIKLSSNIEAYNALLKQSVSLFPKQHGNTKNQAKGEELKKSMEKIRLSSIELVNKNSEVSEKVSSEAQEFISDNIKKLISNGVPQKQAIAISYSQAKKKGFKIPTNPNAKEKAKKNEMVTTHIAFKNISI